MQRITIEPTQIQDTSIFLTDPQIHYLRRVLRLEEGDRFIALDGLGQGWVTCLRHETALAEIVEPWQRNTEVSIPIHLIIAMPKTGMDEIVRQTTELGVSSIWPVISDRTLLNPSDKKVDRWRRIAQEAMEQCERQWVPAIAEPMRVGEALRMSTALHLPISSGHPPHRPKEKPGGLTWICVARSEPEGEAYQHLLGAMLEAIAPNNHKDKIESITVVVGPEGGWTPSEVETAIALGYEPVSLGSRILRAVTATLGAIAVIAAALDGYSARHIS